MSLIDLSCLCILLVFAHLSESRVVILRDYDDGPSDFYPDGRSANDGTEDGQEAIEINTRYQTKNMRSSKKAILLYGTHMVHLDNFEDLKELRPKIFELKKPLTDGPLSYDWRAIDSAKDDDLIILPGTPLHFCNGEDCLEDRKMFRKYDDHKDWKRKQKQVKYIKRFQIIENRHTLAKDKCGNYDADNKKKNKRMSKKCDVENKKKKKKKQNDSSKFKDSEKQSIESWETEGKKKYSSEKGRKITKRPRKKYESTEDWTRESNSFENRPKKIKKKNKKKNYGSDETSSERETTSEEEDYFMQGNNIFHSKDRKKKKTHNDENMRRRLEHFLPKRYHWNPEEIHDLGHFWFNGPKGLYPGPMPL